MNKYPFADIECAATDLENMAAALFIVLCEHHDNLNNPGRLELEEQAFYVVHAGLCAKVKELRGIAAAMMEEGDKV